MIWKINDFDFIRGNAIQYPTSFQAFGKIFHFLAEGFFNVHKMLY